MNKKDQAIYNRIVRIMQIPIRKDEQRNRYTMDLNHGFLFFYPKTGKILLSKESYLKTIFRDENTCWILYPELEEILKQVETLN